jgi:quercetin dioxygenase-like cupin family protein
MVEIREGERISGVGSAEPPKSGGAGLAGTEAGAREGELGVTLLADTEHFGAVEVRSAPGGIAPPLHAHAHHAEVFFVFEGELTFRLEDGEHRVDPETWVFVPPEVVHTFAVTGDEPARFLDIHVPSRGFGDFVRGLQAARSDEELKAVRAAFDQQPSPEYATGDPGLVVIHRAGAKEGEVITDRPERRATLLVDADEVTVSEFVYGPGERGAQLHVHYLHADAFLVVEGEFTFGFRDGRQAVSAPALLLFPPGVVHGFDNDSAGTSRTFNFHMPASGFADYLRGRNPDFDQHDPPADGGVDPASVIAVRLSG